MRIRLITEGRHTVSHHILSKLPEWFGIPSAREAYVHHAAQAPMIGAEMNGQIVGYVSLALHFGQNCKIHSMGVVPDWHRQGCGRLMLEAAAEWARDRDFEYLSVKTLSAAHPDKNYADTRGFYLACGFQPFEELPALWGKNLPCLLLIRRLT